MSLLSKKHSRTKIEKKIKRKAKKIQTEEEEEQSYYPHIIEVVSRYNIKCAYCNKKINPYSYIFICPSCTKDNVYCINCLLERKHPHDYVIKPCMKCNFNNNDWNCLFNLQLLAYIEENGIYNWLPLSENFINKGTIEINRHYINFYVKNKLILRNTTNMRFPKFDESKDIPNEELGTIPDMNALIRKLPRKKKFKELYQRFNYNNKRKEFEFEYLNDAEIELSGLEFVGDEDNNTLKKKYEILKHYNTILDIRQQLQDKIYKDEGIFGNNHPKFNNFELEIIETFLPFINHLTGKDQKKIIEGILIERKLRLRLNYLEKEKEKK